VILNLIIFYILLSEFVLVGLWLTSGRPEGREGLTKVIIGAPLSFPKTILFYIKSIKDPIKGISQANKAVFSALKSRQQKASPGESVPIERTLVETLKSRYPEMSEADAEKFIREKNINTLDDLTGAIVEKERPDLADKWKEHRSKVSEGSPQTPPQESQSPSRQ
jgi:hypothetical protein